MHTEYTIKRVAAYCRLSTKQDEQLNSYENQVNYYTERIRRESGWKLAGIYADKGITGTSMKKRDEFNKLIRQCKRGKVDMIIVKSISRFARNTLDCIKITRMLREIKVDVYFEEQNLHSIDPSSEFYISIYGSIAQSESENISHNVAWGKARSAKEGNVSFSYKSFLGYRKGADGKPEIDSEQAETVRLIYSRFLSGRSLQQIADELTESGIPTPMGKSVWQPGVIQSILSNEKYKGGRSAGQNLHRGLHQQKGTNQRRRTGAVLCGEQPSGNHRCGYLRQGAGGTGKTSLKAQGQADWHDYRARQILRKVCTHRAARLRRMRNALPRMHMDILR